MSDDYDFWHPLIVSLGTENWNGPRDARDSCDRREREDDERRDDSFGGCESVIGTAAYIAGIL